MRIVHVLLVPLAIAIVAFLAGFAAATHADVASATAVPVVPQIADLAALSADQLPASNGTTRSKLFVDGDAMTLGVYIGATAKHYHVSSDEFQYVVAGTGTEWFGDKQIALKPGLLLIIPKGMTHGGVSDRVTILGIKTPPQQEGDNHRLP